MIASSSPALRRLSASGRPLRIGVLASATGRNLSTLLAMQQHEPNNFRVCLVASHATEVKALQIARDAGVEAWPGDFDAYCGLASAAIDQHARDRYRKRAREWHDALDVRIQEWERAEGALDLIVLAYHRWIEGNLLTRYGGRMINQHPGDLSVLDRDGTRAFTGMHAVRLAMSLLQPATRTSCFLVDQTQDGGAILCMGPQTPIGFPPTAQGAWEQELRQKEISDGPCLEWTVRAFAAGRLSLADGLHADGSRVVLVDGAPTRLGGTRLDHAHG